MLFILAYLVIGFIFGYYVFYKMVKKWGWKHLLDDFNERLKLKGRYTEIKVFKVTLPVFTISAITLTWPYFIYLFVNKKYFK